MHDRKLNRLSGFDYSSNRYYFVTMCVDNRIHSFGTIENKSMRLSANGIIAQEQWNWLAGQYPYIQLISFVIMPNHIHGIIFIDVNYYNDLYGFNIVGNGRGLIVGNDDSLQSDDRYQSVHKIKPIPELIGAYKTTVSKRIHLSGDASFKWQKSYHDHIIRNRSSLNRIKNYIETNPENWDSDTFNK